MSYRLLQMSTFCFHQAQKAATEHVIIDGFKGIFGDGTDTPPFSIAAWIRKEGPVGGDAEVIGWGSTGTGNRLEFRDQTRGSACR